MGIKIKIEFRSDIVGKLNNWIEKNDSKLGYAFTPYEGEGHSFENSEEARAVYTEMIDSTNLAHQASKIFFVNDNGEETMVFDVELFTLQLQKYREKYGADFSPRDFVV